MLLGAKFGMQRFLVASTHAVRAAKRERCDAEDEKRRTAADRLKANQTACRCRCVCWFGVSEASAKSWGTNLKRKFFDAVHDRLEETGSLPPGLTSADLPKSWRPGLLLTAEELALSAAIELAAPIGAVDLEGHGADGPDEPEARARTCEEEEER